MQMLLTIGRGHSVITDMDRIKRHSTFQSVPQVLGMIVFLCGSNWC